MICPASLTVQSHYKTGHLGAVDEILRLEATYMIRVVEAEQTNGKFFQV